MACRGESVQPRDGKGSGVKIRSGKNEVAIILTPKEVVSMAEQLVKASLASGGQAEQEPTEETGEEQPT